jgi:hypothetical protein
LSGLTEIVLQIRKLLGDPIPIHERRRKVTLGRPNSLDVCFSGL